MSQLRKILVTLDGSLLAEEALEPALMVAEAMSAELILLRVVTPLYVWAPFLEIEPNFAAAWQRNEAETAAYLEAVREKILKQASTLTVRTVVLTGPVAESIIDYAKENNIDLIIISSHGRSGLGRWVYGSIAEKVLRGARCCSTWLVRPTVSESAAATKEQEEHSIPLQ